MEALSSGISCDTVMTHECVAVSINTAQFLTVHSSTCQVINAKCVYPLM